MLNALPRQTWAPEDSSKDLTSQRVGAYADRMRQSAKVAGANSEQSANLNADEAHPADLSLVLPITTLDPSTATFPAAQEWEGYVTSVEGDVFVAELRDVTAGRRSEGEMAQFFLSDVSPEDRSLIVEGTLFRWAVGYQRLRGGTRQKVSQLYVRRLPKLSPDQRILAQQKANALIDKLLAKVGAAL